MINSMTRCNARSWKIPTAALLLVSLSACTNPAGIPPPPPPSSGYPAHGYPAPYPPSTGYYGYPWYPYK
jgi:hypothetical protein